MPFYISPDDNEPVVPFDDLSIATGRAIVDDNEQRFVALMAHGHVVGFDHKELGQMLASLAKAHAALTDLVKEDAQKKAPSKAGTTEPQTTQFGAFDVGKN